MSDDLRLCTLLLWAYKRMRRGIVDGQSDAESRWGIGPGFAVLRFLNNGGSMQSKTLVVSELPAGTMDDRAND